MKKVILFFIPVLLLLACQTESVKQQYFTSSPEIDLVRKGNAAYAAGNWQELRSMYADTAKVYDNVWEDSLALSPDNFISALQTSVENYTEYTIADNAIYEMVINDEGQTWVHNWFLWKGKHKNGMDVSIPIHLSFQVVDDKVAFQANMYNTLPAYLADNAKPAADSVK